MVMGLAAFWSHLRARGPMGQTSFVLRYCVAPKRGNEVERAGTQMHAAMLDTSSKAPRREPAALHPPLAGKQKHHHSLQLLRALPRLLGQMSNTERLYLRPPKCRTIRERAKHTIPKQKHQLNERTWEACPHLEPWQYVLLCCSSFTPCRI